MGLVSFSQPAQFAHKAEPFLRNHEDVFSLMQGVLKAIQAGEYENPFLATVEEDGQVVALLQMTPPHPLNVVILNENRTDSILETIVRGVSELGIQIPAIVGLKQWTLSLAEKWAQLTGRAFRLKMDEGIYRLDQVTPGLSASPGKWRYAGGEDCSLIEAWFSEFERDAGLAISPKDIVKERVAQFVGNQEVFLWESNGKVVSMMKKSRPTEHGITVSLVFTPKEERRQGYGRTMVAHCSAELLKEYDFCILYTDLANPTSNKIYKEIAYRQIANSVHVVFE